MHRHQLDRPVRRSAHGVLAMPSTQIDRGRGLTAPPTPQLGQHVNERPITVVPDQQAHGQYRLPATAMQFQAAVGPVREPLLTAEGRWVHRSRLFLEQRPNKLRLS
jgi:hypothetical protein